MTKSTRINLRRAIASVFILPVVLSLGFLVLYVGQQAISIYGGDSGELVSAAYTIGVAHPPGYPLYTAVGALLTHLIKQGTVAWRMGFLSSVPMALSVGAVWGIVYAIGGLALGATVAAFWYGLLYPVWLYGIVPEVFGLYALFSSLYVLVSLWWLRTRNKKPALILAFLTGLAFTHHHLIILAVAAFLTPLYLWDRPAFRAFFVPRKQLLLYFGLGFLPYLYAPIVSAFGPLFDTEHASTLTGFFRLITRASYGTFKASGSTTGSILNGFADVAAFFQYLLRDYSVLGLLLAGMGAYALYRMNAKAARFLIAYGILLVAYLFYAGFPVATPYQLGTLERFFIVPYQLTAVFLGLGTGFAATLIRSKFVRNAAVPVVLAVVVAAIPLSGAVRQYPVFRALKHDTSMEKYADDVLRSIPQGGIFGSYQDTTTFALDYALFVQHKRPDIRFVNYYLLPSSYYRSQIKRLYPDVVVPEWTIRSEARSYFVDLFTKNRTRAQVATDISLPGISGYFIPVGLVYFYYPKAAAVPDPQTILAKNASLWDSFWDPLTGALGPYKHLLLADVLRIYADRAIASAEPFALAGKTDRGNRLILYALKRDPALRAENYSRYISDLVDRKSCTDARSIADAVFAKWGNDFIVLEQYHRIFDGCPARDTAISAREREYQRLKPLYETSK